MLYVEFNSVRVLMITVYFDSLFKVCINNTKDGIRNPTCVRIWSTSLQYF